MVVNRAVPCIVYSPNLDKYWCHEHEKIFNAKHSAGTHSSMRHGVYIGGKRSRKPKKEILEKPSVRKHEQDLRIVKTPSSDEMFNNVFRHDKTPPRDTSSNLRDQRTDDLDDIQNEAIKKAELGYVLDSLEGKLSPEELENMRLRAGLMPKKKPEPPQTSTFNMNSPGAAAMMTLIAQEEDPKMKIAMLASLQLGNTSNMMFMASLMKNNKNENEDVSLFRELIRSVLKEKLGQSNKSPIDTAKDFAEVVKLVKELTRTDKPDPLQALLNNKKKLEELSIIKTQADIIEERKLTIEEQKVKFDHERLVAQDNREAKVGEAQTKMFNTGINTLIQAAPWILQSSDNKDRKI